MGVLHEKMGILPQKHVRKHPKLARNGLEMVLNSQNWSKLVPKGSEYSKLNKESTQGEKKWVYFMKKWAFDPKNCVTERFLG